MTPSMKATLEAIRAYYAKHGVGPTYTELAQLRGLKGRHSLHRQVKTLIARGHLARLKGRDRNMAPVDLLARYSTDELRAEIARRETSDDRS